MNITQKLGSHLIDRLSITNEKIIICDANLKIISLTPRVNTVFDINIGDQLDFLCERVTNVVREVIKTKNHAKYTDSICLNYYEIDISNLEDDVVLIFKPLSERHSTFATTLAEVTHINISNFLDYNKIVLENVYDKSEEIGISKEVIKKCRFGMYALSEYNTKLRMYCASENDTKRDMYNLTSLLKATISSIKNVYPMSDITLEAPKSTICLFDKNQICFMFINIISNVFKHVGIDSKIKITIREKADKIYIFVSDDGTMEYRLDSKLTVEHVINDSGSEKIKLGLPLVNKIVENHLGSFFLVNKNGTEIQITLQKEMSIDAVLNASTDDRISRCVTDTIKVMAGYEYFEK